jgi:hypothetical protein
MATDELTAILRDLAQLRARVELMAPAGRERSLALTKLDEAGHWVVDAFATPVTRQ